MADACGELDVTLCGGHTEITHGLDRPIVIGQMLGDVARDAIISGAGARAGDVIILTKGIAVEGTALIAREQAARLAGVMDAEELGRCAGFLRSPGISVVADARLALEAGEVHALHDPTEGGVATGLWELAEAAGLGLRVDSDRLPVLPECARMCAELGLDPLGLIASGSLLIAAPGGHAEAIIERLARGNIAATAIGELLPADQGRRFRSADGSLQPMAQFARDEITRLYQ
jgi:hydrogenase maturation factor